MDVTENSDVYLPLLQSKVILRNHYFKLHYNDSFKTQELKINFKTNRHKKLQQLLK